MGDCLLTDTPSRCVTSAYRSTQPSTLRGGKSSSGLSGVHLLKPGGNRVDRQRIENIVTLYWIDDYFNPLEKETDMAPRSFDVLSRLSVFRSACVVIGVFLTFRAFCHWRCYVSVYDTSVSVLFHVNKYWRKMQTRYRLDWAKLHYFDLLLQQIEVMKFELK